jgi:hypothetical protein
MSIEKQERANINHALDFSRIDRFEDTQIEAKMDAAYRRVALLRRELAELNGQISRSEQ